MSDTPFQQNELLTVDEAAQLIRHRPSTVRDWLLKRKLPFLKLSRRVFIRRSDIEDLISRSVVLAHQVTPQEEQP